ncbi:hypothetical protein EC968_000166 [Mortierella alpina]|nr:hypothetical protein EC968_000166 [Mortierella alpina]
MRLRINYRDDKMTASELKVDITIDHPDDKPKSHAILKYEIHYETKPHDIAGLLGANTLSNNDFSKNLDGLGLARNSEIVAEIATLATSIDMLDRYIQVAQTKVSDVVAPNHFEHARHIFLEKRARALEMSAVRDNSGYVDGL